MDLNQLHFAHPFLLWTLIVIPFVWGLFFLYYQKNQLVNQLERFIDKHLIPYLLLGSEHKKKRLLRPLLTWSLIWFCLALALAGPRWDFREIVTFTRDQSLAVVLDLSESMNAKDVSPSRLARAKQKIEDLLNMSKGVKIGLIAFAADPHMIVPMTEDKETIRHLLPSLDTDLVYIQGSKLTPALEMAAEMFENESGNNNAIIVISDGGFNDTSAMHTAKRLAEKGIVLYTIGVGSQEGAPLRNREGAVVKKNGAPIFSKLEKEKFSEISKIGRGRYFDADHSEQIALIFEDLKKRSDVQQEEHKTHRAWEEQFYLFLLPVLPFFLWWYRRGYIFALLLIFCLPANSQASLSSYFYNTQQQANRDYENEDYAAAGDGFQDPYRKGVAYYRMGNYAAAEEMFRQSTRPEVACRAAYNLGNTLLQQNKPLDAILAYKSVLEKWPDHEQAKTNLEIAKKILEQQDLKEKNGKDNRDKNSTQKNNKQDKQKQKDDKSQKQDIENKSDNQSQEDSAPKEKEQEDSQRQESPDLEESNQNPPEEKEPLMGEEQEKQDAKQNSPLEQKREKKKPRTQADLDADLWLNQIKNNPKSFLRNKFYLETKKSGTKEEVDPW